MSALTPSAPYTANRIQLKSRGRYDEKPLNSGETGLYPGHLIAVQSDGTIKRHAVAGQDAIRAICLEQVLHGYTMYDLYSGPDSSIPFIIPVPGDELNVRLQAGQSVAVGDQLMSAGDGSFMVKAGNGGKLYSSVADSTTLTGATANGAAYPAFDKSYSIPANFLQVGDVLRIKGLVAVTGENSTDTLTLKLQIGSVVVVSTGAVQAANGAEGLFDAVVTVRTIGSSGTIVGQGGQILGATASAIKDFMLASTTLDTTAAQVVKVTADWSSSSASNTAVLRALVVSLERSCTALCEARAAVDNSAGSTELFVPALFF